MTRRAPDLARVDAPARADDLAGILAADWVRLVFHPETVRRYTY